MHDECFSHILKNYSKLFLYEKFFHQTSNQNFIELSKNYENYTINVENEQVFISKNTKRTH